MMGEERGKPLGFAYIATRKCGRVSGLAWEDVTPEKDAAIKFGAASALSFADDGEGYRVCVCVHDMHGEPLPYTDDVARGTDSLVECSLDLRKKIVSAMLRRVPNAPR